MADEEGQEGESEPSGKAAKGMVGLNSLMMILVAVNTAVILGIGVLQFMTFQQASVEPTMKDLVNAEIKAQDSSQGFEDEAGMAVAEEGILFPLESFTANLAQGDGARRFVRMVAVLKFSKDSSEEEFQVRKPQIRDSIISTLNSKRPEDLLKSEGKRYLKEEIKSSINSFLIDGRVDDVFYISFQVN